MTGPARGHQATHQSRGQHPRDKQDYEHVAIGGRDHHRGDGQRERSFGLATLAIQ